MSQARLKLVPPAAPLVHSRLILTEYSGGVGDRNGRSLTLDGAMRAAVMKVALGVYTSATIFDERFGSKSQAIKIARSHRGISVVWPRTPKWGSEV